MTSINAMRREATCLWNERGEEQWNTTTTGIGE